MPDTRPKSTTTRHLRLVIALALVAGLLAACREALPPAAPPPDDTAALSLWDPDPGALVVRLDTHAEHLSPAARLNTLPPCTIWGDGHVVWTSPNPATGEDLLEARVDEATLRGFIESILARGFITWEDDAAPPADENPVIEAITLVIYGDTRTVRRATGWPDNSYNRILDACRHLSDTPVLVMPSAGWVSAYPIPPDPALPGWTWPPGAPFTLRELAESGQARWLEGDLATEIWRHAREFGGVVQVLERGGQVYNLAIVVPGYSREGPASTGE